MMYCNPHASGAAHHRTSLGIYDNVALRTTKGTDEYENPLHAETSFSGAEVSHTRPMGFYRTYSACDFGAVSGERCRAVGGYFDGNEGKILFPSTLFACFSTVCIFESLKIATFSKNAVFDARNFLLRVENFRDFGGLFPSFPGSVR